MGGLLSNLTLGSNALLAQQAGVAVAGRNTANINTVGYQRESVELSSQLGAPVVGGVLAGGARRSSDDLLAMRERLQAGAGGQAQVMATALDSLQQRLTNSSVTTALSQFFGSLNQLQSGPTDPSLRTQTINKAGNLAAQFNASAAAISGAQSDADGQLKTMATAATQLASTIASANKALVTSDDPVLADKRDQAAKELAGLVGGSARIDPDGKMRFVLDNGAVLVDGDRAAQVTATPDAALANHLHIQLVDGTHTTDAMTGLGGQMGGLVSFRDGTAADAARDLDQLAADFAAQVNAVHSGNQGLNSATGLALFTGAGTVAGAAAGIAVNASIVADPNSLATRAPGTGVSDNTGAGALLALNDQTVAGGGTRTFLDEGIRIVTAVGVAARNAADSSQLESARSDMLASSRDSVSGVSQEEELAKLSQFQHAAEAATHFISTVNSLLDTIISQL
jgi:flagellar hook-associated protein 1 FlgK